MQKLIDWIKYNTIYVIMAALALGMVVVCVVGIYMEQQQKQTPKPAISLIKMNILVIDIRKEKNYEQVDGYPRQHCQ